jgi:hypothetical protein
MHAFADEVFAQHGRQCGTAIATARVRRLPGAFKLYVETPATRRNQFAEEQRPTITQYGEMTKLMPSIRLRNQLTSQRRVVACQQLHGRRLHQAIRIQSQADSKTPVQQNQLW